MVVRAPFAIVCVALGGCLATADLSGLSTPPSTLDASGDAADGGGSSTNEGGGPPDATPGDADAGLGPTFFDDFSRPDGPVGNGWVEKTNDVFTLVGGRLVVKDCDYRDSFLRRPVDEAARDVESSVEFIYRVSAPTNDPAVALRIQAETLSTPRAFKAYGIFVDDGQSLTISRQDGDTFATLAKQPFAEPLARNSTYRLKASIRGAPPQLTGVVERLDGATWTEIARGAFTDTSNRRIDEAGLIGLQGDDTVSFDYDNFEYTRLD